MLERKIILISRNIEYNAILIESLLELLSPLNKSVFTNISFLKLEMIDYLDTPLPFVIGISTKVWNQIFMSKWNEVSDDTIAYDFDTELLMTKLDIPSPPEPITSILQHTLNDLFSKSDALTEREFTINLKQAFFNYMLLVINDFRVFYKITYEQSII